MMSKYDRIVGKLAYRTKNEKYDGLVGTIEKDPLPLFSPLILRFENKKGIRCRPENLILVDVNGKDLGKATNFL